MRIEVEVDAYDVLQELTDKELLKEIEERKLELPSPSGHTVGQIDWAVYNLRRALDRRDWPEVEHLLRTYVLKEELS